MKWSGQVAQKWRMRGETMISILVHLPKSLSLMTRNYERRRRRRTQSRRKVYCLCCFSFFWYGFTTPKPSLHPLLRRFPRSYRQQFLSRKKKQLSFVGCHNLLWRVCTVQHAASRVVYVERQETKKVWWRRNVCISVVNAFSLSRWCAVAENILCEKWKQENFCHFPSVPLLRSENMLAFTFLFLFRHAQGHGMLWLLLVLLSLLAFGFVVIVYALISGKTISALWCLLTKETVLYVCVCVCVLCTCQTIHFLICSSLRSDLNNKWCEYSMHTNAHRTKCWCRTVSHERLKTQNPHKHCHSHNLRRFHLSGDAVPLWFGFHRHHLSSSSELKTIDAISGAQSISVDQKRFCWAFECWVVSQFIYDFSIE